MYFESVVTTERQAAVRYKIEDCLSLAARHYERAFDVPDIRYDLRGNVAGKANGRYIRINPELLAKNWDDMINVTIPHEVAHVVVRQMYGGRVKSHGDEWKHVMALFGLKPDRCHSYQTTPARVVKRKHRYLCLCRTHMVTAILHNRMMKGYRYTCGTCGGELRKG